MSNPLVPTFEGYISSTIDALVLFEACLSGQLTHVPRRPHDRERQDLIKSGYVFIYEEHASGIKRWTDGVSWSPSRILNNFLIYRELEKPFPPGEKKRALKKTKKPQLGITKSDTNSRSTGNWNNVDLNGSPKDPERALIGSLIDSYPFKPGGLIKKTISVTFHGVPHHLVSYYSVADVQSGRLSTPTKHHQLCNTVPRTELLMGQNFRSPIDETEVGDDRYAIQAVYPLGIEYPPQNQGGILQRAMSVPSFQTAQLQQHYAATPAHYGYQSHAHQLPPPQPSAHQQHHGYPHQMAPSPSPVQFQPMNQSNYSLDPSRGSNRYPTATAMAQEFPRNMPTQDMPRRHSTFDVHHQPDLSGMPMMGSSGYNYLPQRAVPLAAGHDHHFSSPRQIKGEPSEADNGASQQFIEESKPYELDENAGSWNFDTMDGGQGLDGNQEDQYYPPNGQNNGSWAQH